MLYTFKNTYKTLFIRQVLNTSLLTITAKMLFCLYTKFKGTYKVCLAWERLARE